MQCIPTDQSKSKASTYTRGMDAGNYTLCASQIASETAARLRLPANAKSRGVVACTAEVSIRGQWVHVPALQVQRHTLTVAGKYIKIARIHDEDWLEGELPDVAACIESLRRMPPHLQPDVFSFSQRLPETSPKYNFPFERDSHAVLPVTTFEDWWQRLPRETRKRSHRKSSL
jgi:hypothetical protein